MPKRLDANTRRLVTGDAKEAQTQAVQILQQVVKASRSWPKRVVPAAFLGLPAPLP